MLTHRPKHIVFPIFDQMTQLLPVLETGIACT
jgi:hypothetical protein